MKTIRIILYWILFFPILLAGSFVVDIIVYVRNHIDLMNAIIKKNTNH